jgi:hypothetical protein
MTAAPGRSATGRLGRGAPAVVLGFRGRSGREHMGDIAVWIDIVRVLG